MKTIVVLVSLLAVGLSAQVSDDKEREARQFQIYPASTDFSDFAKNPLLPYLLNNINNPYFRQLARQSSSSSASTVVQNQTSTATVICTISTTACPSGRRRRHVLADLLEPQFEEIHPSPVDQIEITASAVDLTERGGREADPQYFMGSHPNYFSPDASFGHFRNGFNGRQAPPLNLPSFVSGIPFLAEGINLANNVASAFAAPIIYNNLQNAAQAILAGSLPTNVWLPPSVSAAPVTQTSCVWTLTTSTSTPSCSTPGTLLQCPVATSAAAGK